MRFSGKHSSPEIDDFHVIVARQQDGLGQDFVHCFLTGFDGAHVSLLLDHDAFVGFEEHVLRLEVGVHQPHLLEVGAGLQHLPAHDLQGVHGLAVLLIVLQLALRRVAQLLEHHALTVVVA